MPVTLTPSRNDLLLERLRAGRVPRVAPDGTTPWQYYARPFPQEDKRPRIAIVVTGLGQSDAAMREAIDRLPGAVTLVFTPLADNVQAKVDEARAKGHEVLLSVPMQPLGYPANDPAPTPCCRTCRMRRMSGGWRRRWPPLRLCRCHVQDRQWHRLPDAAGKPARCAAAGAAARIDLSGSVAGRGQQGRRCVQGTVTAPRLQVTFRSTGFPPAIGIDAQLAQLERLAQANGVAVGFAEVSNPVSLERLSVWSAGLRDRGIVLAPVTAIVNRQADR